MARRQCRKSTGLLVQVIRGFIDADSEAAISLLRQHSTLWPKLKQAYPNMRDLVGFHQIALDGPGINENKLMFLEQRRNQWHPSPEMRRRTSENLVSKSPEFMKRSLIELDSLFDEHGAGVLTHFDRHFIRFCLPLYYINLLSFIQHVEA